MYLNQIGNFASYNQHLVMNIVEQYGIWLRQFPHTVRPGSIASAVRKQMVASPITTQDSSLK